MRAYSVPKCRGPSRTSPWAAVPRGNGASAGQAPSSLLAAGISQGPILRPPLPPGDNPLRFPAHCSFCPFLQPSRLRLRPWEAWPELLLYLLLNELQWVRWRLGTLRS